MSVGIEGPRLFSHLPDGTFWLAIGCLGRGWRRAYPWQLLARSERIADPDLQETGGQAIPSWGLKASAGIWDLGIARSANRRHEASTANALPAPVPRDVSLGYGSALLPSHSVSGARGKLDRWISRS